jgi:nicotinamide phosphoribosyltransferase
MYKGAVECLWDIFGGTVNESGYKVLDSHVGLIYGDSITLERAHLILKGLKAKGFAANNVVFGVGSYTYQHNTRDTFGFAVKSTYGVVGGQGREIFKDPVTDSGIKKSAKGMLYVGKMSGEFQLFDGRTEIDIADDCLRLVFRDGNLLIDDTIAAIRERARL